MVEVQGLQNNAVCFTNNIEPEAYEQIKAICDMKAFHLSRIRVMPDVHAGKVCTIGTTMTVIDAAVPNIVGVDLGCGLYAVNIGKDPIDLPKFDEAAHFIPSGSNVWEERSERFDLTQLLCYRELKDSKRIERSLGTLGGGNHFIEIDASSDGTNYLVIHSGSRNLGKQVAEIYQRLAIDLAKGKGEYFKQRDEIIRTYKEQGRKSEIQAALKQLQWKEKESSTPDDLCFLTGKYFDDYLHDVKICQQFARRNREKMAEVLLSRVGLTGGDSFHTIHNYIDTEKMILRKGAVSAQKGEILIIPLNMRDGSLICSGKGNTEWNISAPHGAGRLLSRSKAKTTLSMDEFKEQMQGIYTTTVSDSTLDESPMAYKPMDEIIEQIGPAVDIIERITPIYNFKAGD